MIWHAAGRLPLGGCVLFGLLAGLSAALGFLVSPGNARTASLIAGTLAEPIWNQMFAAVVVENGTEGPL